MNVSLLPHPKRISGRWILVPFGDTVRPCPHDTFPNRARSIATSSRPVARVHTGATGTLVPVSRDHLATWNERARSVAPCQLCRVDARAGASDKHTPLRPN